MVFALMNTKFVTGKLIALTQKMSMIADAFVIKILTTSRTTSLFKRFATHLTRILDKKTVQDTLQVVYTVLQKRFVMRKTQLAFGVDRH